APPAVGGGERPRGTHRGVIVRPNRSISLPTATTSWPGKRAFHPSSFRKSSQAYQESFPRVGDEQEIEERHPKEARRFQTSHLQNRVQFGKAIEEQIVSECFMAHGFHGGQERSFSCSDIVQGLPFRGMVIPGPQ